MKEDLLILILMIIIIPLTGELKIYPFHDTFRVSFGTPTFLFLLLWMRKIPLILTGLLVGFSVVVFRVVLDYLTGGAFQLGTDFLLHFSAFFYYLTYALLFYLIGVNRLHHRPLLMGFLSVFIEIAANAAELAFRHSILGDVFSIPVLSQVVIIAVIRTFFALAFFYIVQLHQTKQSAEQQQEQNRHMLLLISGLYEESIQLKKSLQHAEEITRDCYNLYESLQQNTLLLDIDLLSKKLLGIAGQVHEIKKDNQRVHAGISKIISSENAEDYLSVQEIGNLIIQSNVKYASSLDKNIDFTLKIDDGLPPFHIYTMLSLLNNLVSNSVEAIKEQGHIGIFIRKLEDWVEFRVSDNGPGIPPKKYELIFKPGYTTKYDETGKPSTGMGLSYVKDLINKLKGSIALQDNNNVNGTVFIIKLPMSSLLKKE